MKYILSEAHGIGDCILILPVAKAIKAYDKDAYIKVITRSDKNKIRINKSIMSLQSYVDEIDYYSSGEKLHSLWFLLKNIVTRFDIGISIQDYDTPGTSSYPSKILRLCAKRTCGTRITRNSSVKYDEYIDRVEGVKRDQFFRQAFAKLGIDLPNVDDNLLDETKIANIVPTLKLVYPKTVAIIIGTAPVSFKNGNETLINDAKNWPYESWIQLTKLLCANKFNVILLGGPKEKRELEAIGGVPKSAYIHDYIGKSSIDESIALLTYANLVVGADTGMMHCAGAINKPSLTLFGCTDPKEYLPFGSKSEYLVAYSVCSPCFGSMAAVKCKHKECMKKITVDMVLRKIQQIIQ